MTFDKEKLRNELRSDEGDIPHAYQDSLGYWTIGVGHLIDKRKGGKLSAAAREFILNEDIDEKSAELFKALPWLKNHSDNIQRALINMAFQLGVEGLLKFKNTLSLVQQKKYPQAAENALESLWAKQTPNRAKRVTDMIRKG